VLFTIIGFEKSLQSRQAIKWCLGSCRN